MSLLQTWDRGTELTIRELPPPVVSQSAPGAFADTVSAFFRNLKGILVALAIFIALVTAFLLFSPKTYQARSTYIVRSEGSALPVTGAENELSAAMLATDQAIELQIGTEVELLSNTDLHRKVLTILQPNLSSQEVEQQLNGFAKHLKVLPVPKSNLISVTFTGRSIQAAVATLSALNQQYLATRAAIRGAVRAFDFFDSEANRYYQQLQADQKTLAAFESENQVTLLEEQKDLLTRRLSETQSLLNDNQSAQSEAARKLSKMAEVNQSLPSRIETQKRELPDQIGEGHLNSLMVDLENKRQELLTKYHEDDRHVQEVDQQILNTRQSLDQLRATRSLEVQTDVNPLRASVDSDLEHLKIQQAGQQARQRVLASQVNAYTSELARLDQITAQHDDLVRSIRQDEANYELYSKRREQARIDKTLESDKIANVSLVAGPAFEPQPLSQRVLAYISIYVIGSVVIIGAGILLGLWSPHFHAPWEVEASTGAPVLATLPLLKSRHSKLRASGPGAEMVLGLKPNSSLLELGLHDNSYRNNAKPEILTGAVLSVRVDGAYSALVERLRRISSTRPGGLVFAVTSGSPSEGVSHVVHGLSEELRRFTGKRVAVVHAPEEERQALQRIAPGPVTDNAFHESGEEAIRHWLRGLRESNDYVLIDCRSMKECQAALALGRESDGVLLVVGAGQATRTQLRGSMAALSLATVPLVGLALNRRTYPIPQFIYRSL